MRFLLASLAIFSACATVSTPVSKWSAQDLESESRNCFNALSEYTGSARITSEVCTKFIDRFSVELSFSEFTEAVQNPESEVMKALLAEVDASAKKLQSAN